MEAQRPRISFMFFFVPFVFPLSPWCLNPKKENYE